jgi:3-deoxy-D-manno-octulosonic-acid transferase
MIYKLLRIILFPFLFILQLFIPKLRKRFEFESKNKDIKYRSFFKDKVKAHFCFHVSSEGEYEQVGQVIQDLLEKKYKIEILFTSPSVEKRVLELQNQFTEQVRSLRLEIVSYNPLDISRDLRRWVSADIFFMVRYDFFKELLELGKSRKKFILLNASLKNKSLTGFKAFLHLRKLKIFNCIITANKLEEVRFKKLGLPVIGHFDFRVVQIQKRLSLAKENILKRWRSFEQFESLLDLFEKDRRCLYGSFWDYEGTKLTTNQSFLHIIVPHQLNNESLDRLQSSLPTKSHIIDESTDLSDLVLNFRAEPCIIILNLKGILCELYSYFGRAYVGGGFGVSIHSVLEPYLAGCLIFCGPGHHRSTEFDFVKESNPERIVCLEDKIDLDFDNKIEHLNVEEFQTDGYNSYLALFEGWVSG